MTIGSGFNQPLINGAHAQNINEALYLRGRQGFYTIDVTLYLGGGWIIRGKRNSYREQQ